MYTDGLSVITPTGGRPEAFELCQTYFNRQSWKGPLQWIIADDVGDASLKPLKQNTDLVYLPISPAWRPGQNTLARNLLAAIPFVKHDKILVIEDDDRFGCHYFEESASRLNTWDIVGSAISQYYHIPSRQFRIMRNSDTASLGQTGFRSSLLPLLEDVCRSHTTMIDYHFWKRAPGKDLLNYAVRGFVGIKGLPGRPGIGIGHRPDKHPDWRPDQSLGILKWWMGDDADLYRRFMCPA